MAVVNIDDGVLLKRGSIELRISGPAIPEIVSAILEAFAEGPLERKELLERFPSALQETVGTLFDEWCQRRLVEPETSAHALDHMESRTELFFWEHGVAGENLAEYLKARRFVVLGVNSVATALVSSLHEAGFTQIQTVDVLNLRNLRLFGASGALSTAQWPPNCAAPMSVQDFNNNSDDFHCLVATSDLGGAHLIRDWNRFAHSAGIAFFPVVLQNMRGFIGPLTIPGETACYECFRARQNSNLNRPELHRLAEHVAYRTQLGVSAHPAMAASLGNLAALELTKFFVKRIAGWQVGTVYEVDMLDLSLTRRRVLRVPRCTVCDRRAHCSPVSLDERLFTPHQARGE
jgi:bacteriocin biosynthesis cyclodehydratase domain-containing protein